MFFGRPREAQGGSLGRPREAQGGPGTASSHLKVELYLTGGFSEPLRVLLFVTLVSLKLPLPGGRSRKHREEPEGRPGGPGKGKKGRGTLPLVVLRSPGPLGLPCTFPWAPRNCFLGGIYFQADEGDDLPTIRSQWLAAEGDHFAGILAQVCNPAHQLRWGETIAKEAWGRRAIRTTERPFVSRSAHSRRNAWMER